jgi:hypothetical protein
MSALGIGPIVFACLFGGALGGMCIRTVLPEHHRTKTGDAIVAAARSPDC